MIPALFQVVGFLLAVAGVAAWSPAGAAVVAGVVLFVAGGLEQARSRR